MESGRRLSAILFTDMAGSTQLAQRDERAAISLIEEQETLARSLVTAHRGRMVKSTGYGLLLEFPSALDAVECAVELQRRIRERNQRPHAVALQVRIGVHLGDVQPRGTDIFGDAVNVAARVESAAAAGEVCLSQSLYNQVRNKVPYTFESLGPQSLKGVSEPMELYRVVLPWVRGTGHAPVTSAAPRLAVLPLANISPDAKDEYFADGLTEELISALSKIPNLRVIARTSVLPYKTTAKSVAQIGAELGVGSVLEGSVRKAGDRLRISLQLIDVGSQEHIWSERFDRELSDVFAIQSEVAESTAGSIRIELSDRARELLRRPPTTDLVAYDLYLRGTLADLYTGDGFRESVALLEQAVEKDPDFALAYAQLGHRYVLGAGDYLTHHEGFARAREAALRAIELDPDLSDAHSTLAELAMQEDHDWARAEAEFLRALSLNPSNTTARANYAFLLKVLDRREECEAQYRAAVEVDPKAWSSRWGLIDLALSEGNVALAEQRVRELLDPDPNPSITHLAFGAYHAWVGNRTEARRELEAAGRSSIFVYRFARAMALAALGETAEADALLTEFTDGSPREFVAQEYIAALYATTGAREKALELLEEGVKHGETGLWIRYALPSFDSIREDPRFAAMLRSLHLPDTVVEKATRLPPKK